MQNTDFTSNYSSLSYKPNGSDAVDINRRLVNAAGETGIGREGMATICDVLNMPQPMSIKAWNDHTKALYDAHKTLVNKHFQSTKDKVYHEVSNDQPNPEGNTVNVAIIVEVTWSKREILRFMGLVSSLQLKQEKSWIMDSSPKSVGNATARKQKPAQLDTKCGMNPTKNNV